MTVSIFVSVSEKNRYFCNVSQQVLSEVVYRCFSAFFICDVNYYESLLFF